MTAVRRTLPWLALALVAAACSADDRGPLAVVRAEGTAGGQEAGGQGTLRIGSDCVTLVADSGAETTLVWPSGVTRWDDEERAIVLESGADTVRLVDGDAITVSGSGDFEAEWVAEPADECPESTFLVSEVERSR